jgi:monofunctional biosynthetic peptidoglycan transglycosylase
MIQDRLERSGARPVQHAWADWETISPWVAIAVLAAEDQKFPHHHGFDLEAVGDAWEERDARGKLRGASTITQQVAKNLFLWHGRSLVRKGIEAYLTVFLELFWSKERILEIYLNIAEFGPGIHGVDAAARVYFDREPGELTVDQAALLAAVLPSPRRSRVDSPSPYVERRAEWIRGQIELLGGPAYLARL